MIAMATTNNQRDPITFTDIQVEVGVVVRLFLDAIYTRAIEGVGLSEYTNSTIHLIDFARKWECQEILDMIERDIRFNISADDRRDLFDQFLLAIKMEKYELAGHCLRCDPPMIWNNDPVDGSGEWDGLVLYAKSDQTVKAFQNLDPIAESSVFDLTASAYSNFLSLPPNIVWTLLRSSHLARIDAGGDTYECKLGNEFVKLMRLGCEYQIIIHYICSSNSDTRPSHFQGCHRCTKEEGKG